MRIGDILAAQAADSPDRLALVFGPRRWTYAQLNAEVNSLAHGLHAIGVDPGDRIAVLGRNSDRYVVIYFALAKLGALMVPVNFWFKTEEVRYVVEQSESKLLMHEAAFASVLEPLRVRKCVYFDDERAAPDRSGHWLLTTTGPPTEPEIALTPDDPHIILYTSGTTGFPKGAVLTHRNHVVHAAALAEATDQQPGDSAPIVYPLFHTGGTDCVLLPHFLHGGTCVVLDRADPAGILDALREHQLTSLFCVPTVWRRVLRELVARPTPLPALRRCLGSSDTFPPPLLTAILDAFPGADFYQTYGLTEAGCILTVGKLTRQDRTRIDSVGRPLPCVEVRIVDDDDREVPGGQVGEVVAAGDTIMREYWNDAARTTDALREVTLLPSAPESRTPAASVWLHSGDLGRMDDEGYLVLAGRSKDVIISGGENVYPVEVERVLKQHPDLRECAVIGVPDPEWGESVLAVVVREAGATLTEADVIAFVRERLAGFKKPRHVEFVDALPATSATGKLQRAELRARFAPRYATRC